MTDAKAQELLWQLPTMCDFGSGNEIIDSAPFYDAVIAAITALKAREHQVDKLDNLARSIASFKKSFNDKPHSDYITGYLCALSAVEGMIAEVRGDD